MISELIRERRIKLYNSAAFAKPRANVAQTEPRTRGNPLPYELISSALGDVAQ